MPQKDQASGDPAIDQTKIKRTWDGLLLEGYEEGGLTHIVIIDKAQILRDTLEHYAPVFFIVCAHLTYFFTGNYMVFLFAFHLKILVNQLLFGEESKETRNVSKKSERNLAKDWRFKIPLYACHLAETLTWVWMLCLVSDVKWQSPIMQTLKPKTWCQYHCMAAIIGFMTSINITCGHELVHSRDTFHKYLGMTVYTKFFYSHFVDEHVSGHHKYMGQEKDGASARYNESIFQFIPREWTMGRMAVWNREISRIEKQYGEDASWFVRIFYNKMTWMQLLHITILAVIYFLLGWQSLKYQFLYAGWGTFWLIGGNYVEHYGLTRLKDKNGIYESVGKLHSWNTAGSGLFFRIHRHSDHHMASFKPYQTLRRFDDAPWMPFGFVLSFWVGIIPPFWYYCVNPRADAVRDAQLGKTDNKTCYTLNMPMTEKDKWIKKIAWSYFAVITFTMGYFAFFTQAFSVL